MSKATEQRIKHKIKSISKESNVPFNTLLNTLFLERFLVRIGISKYSNKLIFKGGLCLAQFIELGRETRDIDFLLTELKMNINSVKVMIEEIAKIDVKDDFTFSKIQIGELSIEHKKCPGYRISVQGQLGQIQNQVLIDIGVGDVVRPNEIEIKLMESQGALFEESIKLTSYPPEYIFSEKIEAILYLAELNSRMKDFYDCYQLIQAGAIGKKIVLEALVATTKNRGTKLELISEEYNQFESKWVGFCKSNDIVDLDLGDVVKRINSFLKENIY